MPQQDKGPFMGLVAWLLVMIAYHALAVSLGPSGMAAFTRFMIGDYLAVWAHHFAPRLPGWSNPFVLLAALLVVWISRFRVFLVLSRILCGFLAARFIVEAAVHAAGLYPIMLGWADIAEGVLALLWYIATAYWVDTGLRGRLYGLIERLRTD